MSADLFEIGGKFERVGDRDAVTFHDARSNLLAAQADEQFVPKSTVQLSAELTVQRSRLGSCGKLVDCLGVFLHDATELVTRGELCSFLTVVSS